MDGYHIALFVHLCALLGAVAVSAVVHLASARREHARTVGELLEWHDVVMRTSRLFPVALATLVLSGSYMIGAGQPRTWATGFVVAGLVGVVLLLASGIVLSTKGRALKRHLEQVVRDGGADQPPRLGTDVVASSLARANLGVVLGVVFDMTTKPTVAESLGVIALGVALVAAVGWLRRPRSAAEELTTA